MVIKQLIHLRALDKHLQISVLILLTLEAKSKSDTLQCWLGFFVAKIRSQIKITQGIKRELKKSRIF